MRIFLLLCLAAVVYGEVIDVKPCGVGEEEDPKCTINEVRVSPCKDKNACRIKKGGDASISFDFVPHFSAAKLQTAVVWGKEPWTDIDTDGCKSTACPLEAEKAQTYSTKMHIGKKLPNGIYTINWSVFDVSNESNRCCVTLTVKLVK